MFLQLSKNDSLSKILPIDQIKLVFVKHDLSGELKYYDRNCGTSRSHIRDRRVSNGSLKIWQTSLAILHYKHPSLSAIDKSPLHTEIDTSEKACCTIHVNINEMIEYLCALPLFHIRHNILWLTTFIPGRHYLYLLTHKSKISTQRNQLYHVSYFNPIRIALTVFIVVSEGDKKGKVFLYQYHCFIW